MDYPIPYLHFHLDGVAESSSARQRAKAIGFFTREYMAQPKASAVVSVPATNKLRENVERSQSNSHGAFDHNRRAHVLSLAKRLWLFYGPLHGKCKIV